MWLFSCTAGSGLFGWDHRWVLSGLEKVCLSVFKCSISQVAAHHSCSGFTSCKCSNQIQRVKDPYRYRIFSKSETPVVIKENKHCIAYLYKKSPPRFSKTAHPPLRYPHPNVLRWTSRSAQSASHTWNGMQGCVAHSRIKIVGREPSWRRPYPKNSQPQSFSLPNVTSEW